MKNTIVVDIESYTMVEYQKALAKLNLNYHYGGTGVKYMYYTAQGTGKSMVRQIYNTNLCKEIVIDSMSMITDKPKKKLPQFSRAKWYTVECTTWRFSDEYNQIFEWCTEHFGPEPEKPDAWSRWYTGLGYIKFRDETDYILYQLKWA